MCTHQISKNRFRLIYDVIQHNTTLYIFKFHNGISESLTLTLKSKNEKKKKKNIKFIFKTMKYLTTQINQIKFYRENT